MYKQFYGRTLTLKVKYADYHQITRSRTVTEIIRDLPTIQQLAEELLEMTEVEQKEVRLLGLTVSNLADDSVEKRGDRPKLETYIQLTLNF